MPSDVGSSKNGAFKFLKDRVWSKVKGWMEKQLSTGGKEILLKAAAQSIPVFAMSVFCLPKGVCKDITDLIAQYWLGDDEENKKNALVLMVETMYSKV